MTKKRLIRCLQCDAVTLLSPIDRCPVYKNDEGGWRTLRRDDQAAFRRAHRGHPLQELQVVEGSAMSHQDYVDPLRTTYFEATNGKERFVVKRFRKSILDPQRYELIPGKIQIVPGRPRVDGPAIRSELERAFSPAEVAPEKIHRFVAQLEESVCHLDPCELRRVPFEGSNPSLWSFYLDDGFMEGVLSKSSRFLDQGEIRRLDGFIRKNLESDPFLVTVKVNFQIVRDGESRPARTAGSRSGNLVRENH
jgi:hypothetical protein